MAELQLPDYKTLSKRRYGSAPEGSIWGFWDQLHGGRPDKLGSLNLLTPERVLAAKDEIKIGCSVQLDWSLNNLRHTLHDRQRLEHDIIDYLPIVGVHAHDDVLKFNTQCGSQWDGFGHYGHPTGVYYNGVKHADIKGTPGALGINHWCERGGIVGRGVLLDYVGYLEDKGLPVPDPTTNYGFTTHDLDAVARHQGLDFKTGDILFIRTGFVRWYDNAPEQERQRCMGGEKSTFIGLQGSEEAKEWLWDHHFAAVACDTFGFEVNPPTEVVLHETILPLWGTPIGEMFNLEQLSDMCRRQQRWSFFVTSAPLNVPNGIGSPPNIIAIF